MVGSDGLVHILHLTGVQQYSTGAAAVHPDSVATEETEDASNISCPCPSVKLSFPPTGALCASNANVNL
ncbi:hypothetical protein TNCV_4486071 [Trichonephila clavipes]|nr:hypothetical protein TNCV_4486071 [Trichonephila clavipes]